MARSINEILKEADSTNDLKGLIYLWNEIANDKYQYTLIQIRFANEHIRELALKSNSPDIEKGKFYWHLKEMYSNDIALQSLT